MELQLQLELNRGQQVTPLSPGSGRPIAAAACCNQLQLWQAAGEEGESEGVGGGDSTHVETNDRLDLFSPFCFSLFCALFVVACCPLPVAVAIGSVGIHATNANCDI